MELYNLQDDIGERHNLANENIAKRDELLDELLAWFDNTGAQLPSQVNAAYAPEQQFGAKRRNRARKKQE